MIIADVVYGLAGVAILVTGILRVKYFGQGGDFYTSNPVFWIKVSLYILVGLLSLYPTTTYISIIIFSFMLVTFNWMYINTCLF